MSDVLTDLIARHHPSKGEAVKIIAALETILAHAREHHADWQSGIDDGTYESDTQAACDKLNSALELIDPA